LHRIADQDPTQPDANIGLGHSILSGNYPVITPEEELVEQTSSHSAKSMWTISKRAEVRAGQFGWDMWDGFTRKGNRNARYTFPPLAPLPLGNIIVSTPKTQGWVGSICLFRFRHTSHRDFISFLPVATNLVVRLVVPKNQALRQYRVTCPNSPLVQLERHNGHLMHETQHKGVITLNGALMAQGSMRTQWHLGALIQLKNLHFALEI
jgi:hypothetical protein